MKIGLVFFASIILLSSCSRQQSKNAGSPSTKEAVINKIWESSGGRKTWQNSRYLAFSFAPQREGKTVMSRSHLWDRYTGDYRLETKTPTNQDLIVLFNVNSQKGTSYLDGKILADSLNSKEIKKAYGNFINDSYWLLAPLKLEDDGVNVTLEEPEIVDGTKLDVLHLTFGKVGLTPGDQYWIYADSVNGQIKRWKFLLQGKQEGVFNWTDYKDLGGGLKLSTYKQNINQAGAGIKFLNASVLTNVDKDKFTKQ
ncbi:MAG: hypothetical protein WBJ10_13810 [Daejeonella sp.]|uniref:hypothetical protein n=1 Tax=Daejeonella sp. TaxID=2805397 RepID=UPI003C73697C